MNPCSFSNHIVDRVDKPTNQNSYGATEARGSTEKALDIYQRGCGSRSGTPDVFWCEGHANQIDCLFHKFENQGLEELPTGRERNLGRSGFVARRTPPAGVCYGFRG